MGMAYSTSDSLRDLLTRVAAGDVSPADAAARLSQEEVRSPAAPSANVTAPRAASYPGGSTTQAGASAHAPTEPHPPVPVDRVLITAFAREIRVVGDPSVSQVVVEGDHMLRQEGGTIVIDTDHRAGDFRIDHPRSWARDIGAWIDGVSQVPNRCLKVRVNPALPLDLDTPAGSVRISGMHADLSFRVGAGKVHLDDFHGGTLNGQVETGSMHIDALLTEGESNLRTDLGSMHVKLRKGSSVNVSSRTDMGKVQMSGHRAVTGNGSQSCIVGNGTASLRVDVGMGSAQVQLP